jgi:hypothetical protein
MDLEHDFKCPNCGRTVKIKVREMYPGNSKRCVCGYEIQFSGDDGRKAQRALDDLERSLKRLGKR